jgi:uncharacterized damage-inducible protein DinB
MTITAQIAKHLREVHLGGNWTWVNLRDTLTGVDWQQATQKTEGFNTILGLTYHIHYYVHVVLKALRGGPFDAHDRYSYAHPPVNNQADWEQLLARVWEEAEAFAALIEQLPDERLGEIFMEEKYGNLYRNLQGIIEHSHYHLGQIVILKKMMAGVNG